MVVFDTSVLTLAFDHDARAPIDPATGLPLTRCKERIDYLLQTMSAAKQRVLIPTPVLAEYLVRGGKDKGQRLQEFLSSKSFSIVPFDVKAAVECSIIEDGDSQSRAKPLSENESKAKVKFDRQIIAIAKASGAKTIYTGDKNLAARARENKLHVVMTTDLPLPPEEAKMKLDV
jgi:rRNA-processing protein FCF1